MGDISCMAIVLVGGQYYRTQLVLIGSQSHERTCKAITERMDGQHRDIHQEDWTNRGRYLKKGEQ